MTRDLDLVLLGATGFTGGLTAEYLARHAPVGLRWGLAGRNRERLAAVRDRLRAAAGDRPDLAAVELVEADVTDRASLDRMAGRASVVATTVGPFLAHGEPVVAACAAAGTDYVDLTGEPEFVDRMYVAHHETAVRTGARIVHACGFDSVPHDLGVRHAMSELRPEGPVSALGVVRAGATFSGGTFHSALTAMSRPRQARQAAAERRRVAARAGGEAEGRSSRAVAGRPHRDPRLGLWLLPLPTLDPLVVARSGAALAAYGPQFRYSHYAGTRTLRYAAAGMAGAGALAAAAQVPPLRSALLSRVPQGHGPDQARRERSWFTVDVLAQTTEGAQRRSLHTRVSGGDPGYDETAKMLAESALCLAFDDNPVTAGSVTTAQAMGESLTARLGAAGIRFEVVTADPRSRG